MKREREFPDLDALVLAEIASTSSARERHRPHPPQARRQVPATTAREIPAAAPHKDQGVTKIYGDERERRSITGEEAELLGDLSYEEMETPSDEDAPTSLFSPEESAFMHRAIGFLSGRENADMILGQIWEQITTEHPEGFYQMDEASLQKRRGSLPTEETDQDTQADSDHGSVESES